MDHYEALERTHSGGFVLLLDFPVEGEVGLDARSWFTGKRFKGIKMIPPGLHLLTFGAGGGFLQGRWFESRPGSVLVLRWDKANEDLSPGSGMSDEEAARYAEGVRRFDFDAGMAPYGRDDWQVLASLLVCSQSFAPLP